MSGPRVKLCRAEFWQTNNSGTLELYVMDCPDLQALDRLAQSWLTGAVVAQNAAPGLAADLQLARARVEVLEAEARDLAAAKTSAEEKLEHIRVALRGDALRDARSGDYYSTRPRVMANALNQIESLLPPEVCAPL